MTIATDKTNLIKKLAQEKTFTTSAELTKQGFNSQDILELRTQDHLFEFTPDIYTLTESNRTFDHTHVLAKYMVPEGVMCFATALSHWEITELLPSNVHFAVPKGTKINYGELPVTIHYLSEDEYNQNIITFEKEGYTLAVYDVVKTVVDCFAYIWTVGEEHAYKAAYEAITQELCTPEEIKTAIVKRNLESDYLPELYSILEKPDNLWKYV